MGAKNEKARAAVAAAAAHAGGEPAAADGAWPDGFIRLGGRQIAVEVVDAACSHEGAGRLRLRFDRVVLRLVRGVREALSNDMPAGAAALFAVTAPIRSPAKTALILEGEIRTLLASRGRGDFVGSAHENAVRARLVAGAAKGLANVAGFVHNPDSDPRVVLAAAEALVKGVGAAEARRPAGPQGPRWLVVAADGASPPAATWREVGGGIGLPADYEQVLLVSADGAVEALFG